VKVSGFIANTVAKPLRAVGVIHSETNLAEVYVRLLGKPKEPQGSTKRLLRAGASCWGTAVWRGSASAIRERRANQRNAIRGTNATGSAAWELGAGGGVHKKWSIPRRAEDETWAVRPSSSDVRRSRWGWLMLVY